MQPSARVSKRGQRDDHINLRLRLVSVGLHTRLRASGADLEADMVDLCVAALVYTAAHTSRCVAVNVRAMTP